MKYRDEDGHVYCEGCAAEVQAVRALESASTSELQEEAYYLGRPVLCHECGKVLARP